MSDLMVRGPLWGGTGVPAPLTAAFSGAQRVVDAHARYMQAVIEGRVFMMDSDTITITASQHVTKAALGTAKFINGFYNPRTSGRYAVILAAHVATVSGTPAGPYFWNYFSDQVVNSVTTGTIRNALLASAGGASAMSAQTNVTLTTNPAITTALNQLAVMGGPAAIATGAGLYDTFEEVAGRIIVPPGTLFGLVGTGAGTSHVVQSTLTWEEIPTFI